MRRTLLEIPIPFTDLHLPIYSYGFMLMLGFMMGLFVVRRKAYAEGLNMDKISDLCLMVLISSIFGARLLFVLHHYRDYLSRPLEIFMLFKGGLSFYGGFFTAIAVGALACRRWNLPPLKLLDMMAVGLAIGLAFGRIGCFLNGCCYGKPVAGLAWAVAFPKTMDAQRNIDGSPPFIHHLEMGWVGFADPYSLPVHPTQLYEAMWALIMFLVLDALYKYKKRDGELALLFCILYAPMRFFFEMLRDDSEAVLAGLTLSQVIGIPTFLLALYLFIDGRRKLGVTSPGILALFCLLAPLLHYSLYHNLC
ncbi:MAG TPA: prolipoprotein diacylglyceryl transferase [Candidatus Hypogeohydataceae bacterium YC41]